MEIKIALQVLTGENYVMLSKVLGDPHMKDSLETEYYVGAGGKSLIK